jgi:cbb3-type cytochrome oxidase subunit 1
MLMILSNLHFWQLIIVAAAISLPLGYSTSKEYRARMAYRYCS